ncbi:hypothetical protein BKM17_22700 [Pseudomonas syringae group genomosp. 3]|nr:hypothetical protein BKM17_22700 [Pseudomonas syringae group genomosp. 3]
MGYQVHIHTLTSDDICIVVAMRQIHATYAEAEAAAAEDLRVFVETLEPGCQAVHSITDIGQATILPFRER